MEKKLKEIFSEVFDIKLSDINDMSSPDNIAEWDSLKHTNLNGSYGSSEVGVK